MNKILVKLYVPTLERNYDIWLPLNKKIGNVILLLVKAISEINREEYKVSEDNLPILYNKLTAIPFDVNLTVKECKIKNGSEIILI